MAPAASANDSTELTNLVPFSIPSTDFKITGKWNSMESDAINCTNCRENDKGCCVVRFDGKRYLRNKSFVLTEKGKVDSIYSYAIPLGVDIYSIEEFLDSHSLDEDEKRQLTDGLIYWNKKLEAVIDNNDTISGLKVDQENSCLYKVKDMELIQYEFKK
ncbi:MAG: hypothetical protein QE487_16845 [Fluviicola sp.]|nr:hypothetical protein [Fluviicola sp.]